jgi:uncharacterized protein YndB with AHSA1/START domain
VSTLAHTVTREVVLDAPPEQVWEALTDQTALSEWLAPEVELDPREGGEVVCRFEDGEERLGEVELVEEAERLAFHWWREGRAPSRVEFTLTPLPPGTRLTVTETRPLLVGRRADFPPYTRLFGPSAEGAGLAWGCRLETLRLTVGRLVLA